MLKGKNTLTLNVASMNAALKAFLRDQFGLNVRVDDIREVDQGGLSRTFKIDFTTTDEQEKK
jgi:hypothetical protein